MRQRSTLPVRDFFSEIILRAQKSRVFAWLFFLGFGLPPRRREVERGTKSLLSESASSFPLHAWRAGGRGSRPALPGQGASPRRPAASPGGRRSPGPSPARPPAAPAGTSSSHSGLLSPSGGGSSPSGRGPGRAPPGFARRRQPRGDPSPDPEAERRGRARAAPRWRRGTWPWCGPTGRRRG